MFRSTTKKLNEKNTKPLNFLLKKYLTVRNKAFLIAPYKGMQDSLGFRILRRGFRIPATGFRILGK